MTDTARLHPPPASVPWIRCVIRGLSDMPTGALFAAPIGLYLLVFFVGPLIYIGLLALMPSGMTSVELMVEAPGDGGTASTFAPTLDNFARVFEAGYFGSFLVSLKLAVISTVILLVLCYPLAYGLAKVFGRLSPVLTLFFLMPLFVSETIRLYGWTLFFLKGGILNGLLGSLGLPFPELMYTTPIIVLGLVSIYLPFMLFPLVLGISLVDDTFVTAARDLGAGRFRTFWRIELPLATPGIVIGVMLTFVLTLGSMAESQILGGQRVMMIAHSIDFAFSWQQDWPLGSAISVLLISVTLVMMLWLLMRIDFDKLFRRR